MISIVVTGHGSFADGLLSAVQLISGEHEGLCAVNFPPEDSTDDLRTKLISALTGCDGNVLILTDIAGGSPFNISVTLRTTLADRQIEVLSGTNIPILLAAVMERKEQSLDELCSSLLETGRTAIKQFRLKKPVAPPTDDDDGI